MFDKANKLTNWIFLEPSSILMLFQDLNVWERVCSKNNLQIKRVQFTADPMDSKGFKVPDQMS